MVDLGGFDARATVMSSAQEQARVFAKHRARMQSVDEEWRRGPRSFRIIGNNQVGYHVRACGNHRCLSDPQEPLKTLEAARNWLTYYYPGAILESSDRQGAAQ